MQMKEILHQGVIKLSLMCAVGGGVLREKNTVCFLAQMSLWSDFKEWDGEEGATGLNRRVIGLAWEPACRTPSGTDCTESVHGF